MTPIDLFVAALMTSLLLAGDYTTMLAAREPNPRLMLATACLWVVSIPGWYWLDKTNRISTLGAVFVALSLIGTTAMGITCFGDKLNAREWTGIGLAMASVFLLSGKA